MKFCHWLFQWIFIFGKQFLQISTKLSSKDHDNPQKTPFYYQIFCQKFTLPAVPFKSITEYHFPWILLISPRIMKIEIWRMMCRNVEFNPFVPNAPFLYPLKASENRKVFRCFQGVEKGCTGNKWVNIATSNDSVINDGL